MVDRSGKTDSLKDDERHNETAMSAGATQSMTRNDSQSMLNRSNIGANSMAKLTGVQSQAQLIPQSNVNNEIQVRIHTLY